MGTKDRRPTKAQIRKMTLAFETDVMNPLLKMVNEERFVPFADHLIKRECLDFHNLLRVIHDEWTQPEKENKS